MDSQRRARVKEIIGADTSGVDALITLGNMKSELAGMQFALNMPEMLSLSLDDEIREILDELEGDEDEQ